MVLPLPTLVALALAALPTAWLIVNQPRSFALGLLVAASTAVAFFRPDKALYALIAIIPLQLYFDFAGTISISLAQVLILLLVCGQLAMRTSRKALYVFGSYLTAPLMLLLLSMTISVVDSRILSSSIPALLRMFTDMCAFFVVLAVVSHESQVRSILLEFLLVGLTTAVVAIPQAFLPRRALVDFVTGHPALMMLLYREEERVAMHVTHIQDWLPAPILPFAGTRELGAFLYMAASLALVVATAPASSAGRVARLLARVLVPLAVLALILTGGIGSLAGLLVSFAVVVLFRRSSLGAVLGSATAISGGWFIVRVVFAERFQVMTQRVLDAFLLTPDRVESFEQRLAIWVASVEVFKANWVNGVGWGALFESLQEKVGYNYSHNLYLDVAAQTGVLGLLAFVWLYLRILKLAYRTFVQSHSAWLSDLSVWCLAVFVGVLVHSLFDTYIFYHEGLTMLFAIMMGLLVVGKRVAGGTVDG